MSKFTLAWLLVFFWLAVAGGPALAQVKSKSEGKPGPEIESRQRFFDLDPINVAVVRGSRIRAQITFTLSLELTEDADRSDVIESLPRLRHAYLLDLKEYVDRHRNVLRTVKLRKVKRFLLKSTVRILGKDIVRAVLVQRVFVYRF